MRLFAIQELAKPAPALGVRTETMEKVVLGHPSHLFVTGV